MSVNDDATSILDFLINFGTSDDDPKRGRYDLRGEAFTEKLGMDPDNVNDAVKLLESNGYVKMFRTLGGAPYTFRGVSVTPEGRHSYEVQKQAFEAKQKAATDNDSWESYPQAEAADVVPLLKRSSFDRDVVRACAESSVERPVAVLMVDVDNFKDFNTKYGHQGGDEALVGVAWMLRRVVGRKGRAYRYGGDEFSALLIDFTKEEAHATAERFRGLVEALRWADDDLQEMRVTVTVGVADSAAGSAEDLIRRADKALYEAKDGGRNRVGVEAPQVP